MGIIAILDTVQSSAIATAVRGDAGWEWLFPVIETLHVMCFSAVVGTILMVDLRLLNIRPDTSSLTKIARECLPVTWMAFAGAATTGSLLFVSKAQTYFHNPQFELKFVCLALAGLNMIAFHAGPYRQVHIWDQNFPPPASARIAGAVSLTAWIAVIFFGRWAGWNT